MSKIDFQIMSLKDFAPYERNARVHSRRQIGKIAASISEYGFTNPILVDEHNEIIAGHGRREAAALLGLEKIPAIRVCGLSQIQKKALRLADNKLALDAQWSVEMLAFELDDLTGTDFDVTLSGFDTIEVDKILTPSLDEKALDKALPPLPIEPVTRVGDLWQLGDHLLFIGDSRDPSAYRQLLGSQHVALVFTDPPYNVPIKGHVSGNGRTQHSEFQMASGEMLPSEFRAFLSTVLGHCYEWSRDGSLHYIFADWRMIGMLTSLGEDIYSKLMNVAAWIKPNGGMGSFYRSQHELVAVFKKGTVAHVNNVQLGRMGRYRSNVWQYPGASGFSKTRLKDLADHPTVKPVNLVADAIRDASNPGDLVLDPFGGAGTTLLAAEITKRRATLIEIEPRFADVCCRRFQEHTGLEPFLLPDRTPFSMVRTQRAVYQLEKT